MKRYACIIIAAYALFHLAESGIYSQSYYKQNYQQQSQNSYYSASQDKYNGMKETLSNKADLKKSDTKISKKLGISAWGIIGIVVGIIIFSTISYYVFILYPYFCKKADNYDMIELTDVTMCNVSDITQNGQLYPANSSGTIN